MTSPSPLLSRLLGVGAALLAVAATARAADWKVLFDGRDTSAWYTFGKPVDAPIAWGVEDGALAGRKGGGNLATKELYGDFELELEWRISPGGNSGVLFRVDPKAARIPFSGPEIQVLDNSKAKDGGNPLTAAGALYALYAPSRSVAKPAGQWNTLRLRVQGPRVQSWLNGVQVIDAEIGSADWNERVARSKFAKSPEFAKSARGVIVLQDHGNPVWFRNIRVRRL